MAAASDQRCHLLKLPPELRNYIYSLVLGADRYTNLWDLVDTAPNGRPYIRLRQPVSRRRTSGSAFEKPTLGLYGRSQALLTL